MLAAEIDRILAEELPHGAPDVVTRDLAAGRCEPIDFDDWSPAHLVGDLDVEELDALETA